MISTEWLLETGLRAAGVLALTAVLVRTVSRSSASLRHLAWAIALAGVIMVPMLSSVMPFRLAVRRLTECEPGRSRGLDVICDGVAHGTDFVYPAEAEGGTWE